MNGSPVNTGFKAILKFEFRQNLHLGVIKSEQNQWYQNQNRTMTGSPVNTGFKEVLMFKNDQNWRIRVTWSEKTNGVKIIAGK